VHENLGRERAVELREGARRVEARVARSHGEREGAAAGLQVGEGLVHERRRRLHGRRERDEGRRRLVDRAIHVDRDAELSGAHGEAVQVPGLHRLGEALRRPLLGVRQARTRLDRLQVHVDRTNRRIQPGPDAAVAASGIGRPTDLFARLARVVAEQVVALASVERVELDLRADVAEALREDARGRAREHTARG
jgi:hypothetical protein